ncbi:MAG: hypothetical protein ACRC5R_05210 [Mycoplasmatales bacterium]
MKKLLYTHFLVVSFLVLGSITHEVQKKRKCHVCTCRRSNEN